MYLSDGNLLAMLLYVEQRHAKQTQCGYENGYKGKNGINRGYLLVLSVHLANFVINERIVKLVAYRFFVQFS